MGFLDQLPGWLTAIVLMILTAWAVLLFCLPFFTYAINGRLREVKAEAVKLNSQVARIAKCMAEAENVALSVEPRV